MAKVKFLSIDLPNDKPKLNTEIISKIKHRRLQILVNSAIYYKLCSSIIEDVTFDRWAYELRDLQKKYPEESKAAPYYEEFKNWDASTGFDLPIYNFIDKAEQLVAYKQRMEDEDA